AFIASAAGGLFKFTKVTKGNFFASVIGGLLMGYGARLAFGCNIGAYFGGIASFSLHGYIWGIMAIGGTHLALYLRPLFGLSVPKANDSVCERYISKPANREILLVVVWVSSILNIHQFYIPAFIDRYQQTTSLKSPVYGGYSHLLV